MVPKTSLNVGKNAIAGFCFFLLVFVLLSGCLHLRVFPDLDNPVRQRRSLMENVSISTLSCSQQNFPMDETVDAIAEMLSDIPAEDDYVSLVRLNINNGNLSGQSDRITWHWALGHRGRSMLTFPYDNNSLSLTTLGYGLHSISINMNGSLSEVCLPYSLLKLVLQVRLRVTDSNGLLGDIEDDIICKEWFSSSSFGETEIPGYSIFEYQAMSYHECWNANDTCAQGNCIMNSSFRINCTIVHTAFTIAYILLFLILLPLVVLRIYQKAYNYKEDDEGETVNILQINFITPASLMFVSGCEPCCSDGLCSRGCNRKIFFKVLHISSWVLLFLLPFLFYLIIFLLYLTSVDEYGYRSGKRGLSYRTIFVGILDGVFANILYVIGCIVFCFYVYKYRLTISKEYQYEKPKDFESKKWRIACYVVVFILCFFRFSAALMLFVEILILVVYGIAINIKYGNPIWINWIVGVLFCIAAIVQFFDKYQNLFNKIYLVGKKVDKDGEFSNKIFVTSPQTQFNIQYNVLRDIIRKWLPFWHHLFKTFYYLAIGIVLLVVLAIAIINIDRVANISPLVEYLITVVPIGIAAAVKLKDKLTTPGGTAKNRMEDELLKLEEDLRKYAKTGVFPLPGACQCCSCLAPWCLPWSPCCARINEEGQEETARDADLSAAQPRDRSSQSPDFSTSSGSELEPPSAPTVPSLRSTPRHPPDFHGRTDSRNESSVVVEIHE